MNTQLTNEQIIALHRASCQDNLSTFVQASMPIVAANAEYKHNWHIDAICEFLTEIYKGNIKRGIINMPPRMTKSICASICFPAWLLGKNPKLEIMHATYGKTVADHLSVKTRELMKSEFYNGVFPKTIISDSQDQKHLFATTAGGQRFATAFDGVATGLGGNFLIADDPINAQDANSPREREKCIQWYDDTLVSRLNDRKNDRIFVVMQRLHIDDLSAHLESEGGYEILKLPIYATKYYNISIGNKVWEMQKDSYLHEERFGKDEVKEMGKKSSFQAQYMQDPQMAGGREIDTKLIQYYSDALNCKAMNIGILVDPANSKKDGSDYTAMMVVGLNNDDNYYLLEIVRDRFDLPERGRKLMNLVRKWKTLSGKMPKVGIEKYGMMVEDQYIKQLQKEDNYRFPMQILGGTKLSKDDRIRLLIPDIKDQKWFFPEKQLYTELKGDQVDLVHELVNREMGTFPGGIHPDMLDALARVKDSTMMEILKFPKGKSDTIIDIDSYNAGYTIKRKSKKKHWTSM